MPRVHFVKKARKDHPGGIKKGDSYYHWKFRYSSIRRSKARPRPSQLTQSAFLGQWYEVQEEIEATSESIEVAIETAEELLETCQESLDNMPYHLQDSSSSGELLQERIDGLEDWLSEAQGVDLETATKEDFEGLVDNLPSF